MTKIDVSGAILFSIYIISSNNDCSYLCLPEVSTMITSYFYSLKNLTPASAIFTGSFSFLSPKKAIPILAAFIFNYSKAPALKVSAHTRPTLN